MLFSLLKHYLDTNTALKVSQSVYCFTTSISYGIEQYFPRLWCTGISDAIFLIKVYYLIIFVSQGDTYNINNKLYFSCLTMSGKINHIRYSSLRAGMYSEALVGYL